MIKMEQTSFTERLMEFGLTRQEASIYQCLLTEGKVTGYEVAKQTGISRSNAYNSLASMTEKGAAYLVEEASTRKYVPVPLNEFCKNRVRKLEESARWLQEHMPSEKAYAEGYITIEGAENILNKIKNLLSQVDQRVYISCTRNYLLLLIRELDPELAIVFLTSSADYVYEGYEIPVYYDPMIGKLIVWATSREYAIERMRRVLHEYKITGLKTNISYLRRIMDIPDFVHGTYDTSFIGKHGEELQHPVNPGDEHESENIAMIAAYMDYLMNLEENASGSSADNRPISRWREFGLQKGVLRI